jgi:adenylate kinase
VVKARMAARGRSDDTPEAIDRRLELYERETEPLLEWFAARGLLVVVDGLGTEDEVFDRLVAAVEMARG